MGGIRKLLWIAGLSGFLFFSGLFALSFSSSSFVERTGQTVIQSHIKSEVSKYQNSISEGPFSNQLEFLKSRYDAEAETINRQIEAKISYQIADVVARMCQMDCEKKERLRQSLRAGMDSRLSQIGLTTEKLEGFIQNKYSETVHALRQDFRIFAGTNAFLFLLTCLALKFRKGASVHLLIPAALLMVTTVLGTALYIFGQNWFHTIIFSTYWGYAYTVYVAVAFLFLLDIFLNRARVTTIVFNAIGSLLSSVFSNIPVLLPC